MSAGAAVLTVSQQYASARSKTFNRNYVTVTHLNASNGRALTRSLNTRAPVTASKRLGVPGGVNMWGLYLLSPCGAPFTRCMSDGR